MIHGAMNGSAVRRFRRSSKVRWKQRKRGGAKNRRSSAADELNERSPSERTVLLKLVVDGGGDGLQGCCGVLAVPDRGILRRRKLVPVEAAHRERRTAVGRRQ